MSDNVVFGISAPRNITFHYLDEQDITKEEWRGLTDTERDTILSEYVIENVDVWWVEDE